jgi:hypothetical protein
MRLFVACNAALNIIKSAGKRTPAIVPFSVVQETMYDENEIPRTF